MSTSAGWGGWGGAAKPCDQLPIRLENGTLKEITVHVSPSSSCHRIVRLIKLLQGMLARNAIQFMSDALQILIGRDGGGGSGREDERYKIVFQHEFEMTSERQACKSFPMSKQVPLIMHRQHLHKTQHL